MNLLEKRKLNKQLRQIKTNNNDIKNFLTSIEKKYKFDDEDKKNVEQVHLHMDNLNVIFTNMSKQPKK